MGPTSSPPSNGAPPPPTLGRARRPPPRLHSGARRQRLLAAEVGPVDAVELLLLPLVLEPDDDLEQAIHVGAGGFDELLQMIHDDPHLALERDVGERRDRLLVGARRLELTGELGVERRQPGNVDHIAVPDAEIERPAGLRHVGFDDLFLHDEFLRNSCQGLPYPPAVGVWMMIASPASTTVASAPFSRSMVPSFRRTQFSPI